MEKKDFYREFNKLVCDVCNAADDLCGVQVPDTDEERQAACLELLRGVRVALINANAAFNGFPSHIHFGE